MSDPLAPARGIGHPSIRGWLLERRWLVLALGALFTLPRIWYLWSFQAADYDLGIYHELAAGLAAGQGFHSDILGHDHLAEHWNPVMLLFAPAYRLWESAYWLMLAQGAAAAATVLGLMWLAERAIATLDPGRRRFAWWGLLLLFVIYRPLCDGWWFSFQPMVLGAPCVAWALVFLHLGRLRSLAAAVALLLATREAAVLTSVGLAWYAWQVAGRPRVAIAIAAAAGATAALIFGVVMPWAQAGQGWGHTGRLGPLADPLAKLHYLGALCWRAGLLPLLAPRLALAALPPILLNVMVATPNQYSGYFHYNAQLSVFLLAAAAVGMARLLRWVPSAPAWRPAPTAIAGGLLALAAATGDILPLRKFARALAPERWIAGLALQRDLAGALAAARVPAAAPLAADEYLGPRLCTRPGYRTLYGEDAGALVRDLPPGLPIVVRAYWWDRQCAAHPDLPRLVRPLAVAGGVRVMERLPPGASRLEPATGP